MMTLINASFLAPKEAFVSEVPNDSKMAEAEHKKRIAPTGGNPLKILD